MLGIEPATKLSLFDSLDSPILLYGSGIWGLQGFDCIDKIHIEFCKILLGVRQQTPNYAVYGELGRFLLSVISKERAVQFWLKILRNTESLTFKVFKAEVYVSNNLIRNQLIKRRHWATGMKCLMESLGFAETRIRDQVLQHWCSHINNTPNLEYYSMFKTSFGFKYLECIINDKFRKSPTAFRISAHNRYGRYHNSPRNLRTYKLCNMQAVESEFHFLLTCPAYRQLRHQYIGLTSGATVETFISIMSVSSKSRLLNLSKYIYYANSNRMRALTGLPDS